MERRRAGLWLLVLGLAILLVSATADLLGLGADPRFGPKQITGSLAGLALIGLGGFIHFGKRR